MNLAARIIVVIAFGLACLTALVVLSNESKHTAADRALTALADDRAQQQETSEALKRLSAKISEEEQDAAQAKDRAYRESPQGMKLEALRQDDLRAMRQ